MGCCASVDDKNDDGSRLRNEEIDKQLKKDQDRLRNEIKMLLLGAGESGKSTVLKQMKLIHDGGYSQHERECFRAVIFNNTVQSMRVILEAMEDLGIDFKNHDNLSVDTTLFDDIKSFEGEPMPHEVATAVSKLWRDPGVQEAFGRRNEYQLNDSAEYYFNCIDRIGQPDYVPTDQDVLRSRVKTTGITESTFQIGNIRYRMFDVGGQRSERKKWIHCFENVTAIVFLVAISEYNQVLIEDQSVNRMVESLTLFDSICNSRWFEKTSIILFLNKIDLFKQKLMYEPLNKYFPEYRGPNTYEATSDYIQNRFTALNQSKDKQIYTHFTCATDTEQIEFVMTAVSDIVLQTNLRNINLV